MPRSPSLRFVTAGLLLGGAFLAGRWSRSPEIVRSVPPASTSILAGESAPVVARDRPGAAPAAGRLRPDELALRLAAPTDPEVEAALLSDLTRLAAEDPGRALAIARSAPTPRQRELYLQATLRGWAGQAPRDAADWIVANVPTGERRAAVEALVQGALHDPDSAAATLDRLRAADPELAGDHGNTLVAEFARVGRFDLAGRYAASGPAEYRAWWLATAYGRWAQYAPRKALASLSAYEDPAIREAAAQGLIAGWAASDPAGLVASAREIPDRPLRVSALNDGLRQWVHLDPGAASKWMESIEPAPELDPGAAALATTPALVSRRPEVAASWAESIVDPGLRADTLLDFVRLWAETDPAAAQNYAATSPALRPETRALALSSFQPSP